MRADDARLADIQDAIEQIQHYAERGHAAFEANELIRVWMVHHLEIIGEALRSMSDEFQRENASRLDWSGWTGLRNVLAHQYFRVSPEIVWQTIARDVPKLERAIADLTQERPPAEE